MSLGLKYANKSPCETDFPKKNYNPPNTGSSLQWVAVDTMLYLLSRGEGVVGGEGGPGAEPPAGLAGEGIFPVVAGGQQVTQPPAGAP